MSLRHNDSKHGTPRTRGRTWQRIRLQVLAEEPLCRACQAADRVTAAAEVDHIKPLHHGGTDERSNLQPLCAECHEQKTRAELGYEEREVVGLDGWPVVQGRGGRSAEKVGVRVNRHALSASTNRPKSGVDFAPPVADR